MKIAMVGAGGMGSIFGAAFADGGVDTVFVDVSAPLVEKLQRDGLVLVRDGEERTLRVTATTDAASVGTVDAGQIRSYRFHHERLALAVALLALIGSTAAAYLFISQQVAGLIVGTVPFGRGNGEKGFCHAG